MFGQTFLLRERFALAEDNLLHKTPDQDTNIKQYRVGLKQL